METLELYVGEMEATDLKASTMSVDSRVLLQVTIDDIEYDETIISTCMGDNVALRKEMILEEDMGELIYERATSLFKRNIKEIGYER